MVYLYRLNVTSRVLLLSLLLYLTTLTCCKREHAPPPPPRFLMTNSLFDVFFTDAKTGWAVGKLGKIVHTGDGEETWRGQKSHTDNNLRGVYFLNDKLGWVVGDLGTLLHTTDGGQVWMPQASGTTRHLREVLFLDDSRDLRVADPGAHCLRRCGQQCTAGHGLGIGIVVRERPDPRHGDHHRVCG